MPKSTGKQQYGNDSISALKGADRVRKRPGVIFGSDGLEGCEHAVFEILSNAIDEAREGHGDTITITRYEDKSIEVEDFGRGCPVDWSWFSANSMPEASTTTWRETIMSTPWVSTAWAPVPHSMLLSILTL